MFIKMFFLPVMLLLLSGGSARVVDDFQCECFQHFAKGQSPTILQDLQKKYRYRQICQTLNDVCYYATLYDTQNKIPVYSAYAFKGYKNCERSTRWYIETQLDDNNAGPNMALESSVFYNWSEHQASNRDYELSPIKTYDKGHLAPVRHTNSRECSVATFTLTNAAPQYRSFNRGQWKVVERIVAETLTEVCIDNTAYIVTGVVPGSENINNRVNVPSHFWTAYCCSHHMTRELISGGVIGVNSKENLTPDQMTVRDLDEKLTEKYGGQTFHLFDDNCKNAPNLPLTKYDRSAILRGRIPRFRYQNRKRLSEFGD